MSFPVSAGVATRFKPGHPGGPGQGSGNGRIQKAVARAFKPSSFDRRTSKLSLISWVQEIGSNEM
jgi:hypothetical protein